MFIVTALFSLKLLYKELEGIRNIKIHLSLIKLVYERPNPNHPFWKTGLI